MEFLDAIDTATSAIEKAEEDYRKKVKDDVISRVEDICDLCEGLAEEFCAVDFEAVVSNALSCIILSVDAPDMLFQFGRSHQFFEAIKSVDRVSFSATRDNGIHVAFRIDDIWEGK